VRRLDPRSSAEGVIKRIPLEHFTAVLLRVSEAVWIDQASVDAEWNDGLAQQCWKRDVESPQNLKDVLSELPAELWESGSAKLRIPHFPLLVGDGRIDVEVWLDSDWASIEVLLNGSDSFELVVGFCGYDFTYSGRLRDVERAIGRPFDEETVEDQQLAVVVNPFAEMAAHAQEELERSRIKKRDGWIRDLVIFGAIVLVVIYSIYITR